MDEITLYLSEEFSRLFLLKNLELEILLLVSSLLPPPNQTILHCKEKIQLKRQKT